MLNNVRRRFALATLVFGLMVPATAISQTILPTSAGPARIFEAAGPDVASIQTTVDAFRAALGGLNQNLPGSRGAGRREINGDGVPDQFADPNPLPPDFFNVNSPRGAVFFTPARQVLVSADADNPTDTPIEFGRFNRTYPREFTTFSPERLFSAAGGPNLVYVRFFIPGEDTRAVTTGFGAVFTDVDRRFTSRIDFYGPNGRRFLRRFVPAAPGSATLSFLGVVFDTPVITRVRLRSGNVRLGRADSRLRDAVVMDDFIYGEPRLP